MGPAAFIIAILGCGEGDAPCEAVRMLEPRYRNEAACQAAAEAALIRNSDADYPVMVAQCVAAGARPAGLKADEIRLPPPQLPRPRIASR